MTAEYNEGVVRRFWEDIFGRCDIGPMDEVLAVDFKMHDLIYGEVHRLMGTKRIVRGTHNDVSAIGVLVEDQRSEEDGRVFTRFTVRVPAPLDAETSEQSTPPGDGWEYSGMSMCRLVEGEVEELWLVWEVLRAAEELEDVFGVEFWRWPPWR